MRMHSYVFVQTSSWLHNFQNSLICILFSLLIFNLIFPAKKEIEPQRAHTHTHTIILLCYHQLIICNFITYSFWSLFFYALMFYKIYFK